ncbi:trans-aconitate 2-methyltransferase [Acidisphaera sp. L21]|uniref:trans-aconitate 2-methyltransferase n=1 Tax=Acidisphaera sp. L21 TaxID=1641851 RepID=UPI00131AC80A|nr:trans-aconitate 2-methyltransferase [Acidisphaera sp. L21]
MAADSWDPALYRRFETQRTQPARDLLARVELESPRLVVDLGCGPGNSTELLVNRFPGAEVIGVDTSESMLETAGERLPGCRFELGDIGSWTPDRAPDLIYANAALQWVPDHATLVPRLFGLLAPGGVLAVQVPDNRHEPSHRLMREIAASGPWAATIGDKAAERLAVLPITAYYDILVGAGGLAEVWRTIYHHPMDSAAAIVQWVSSTGLQPFIKPLSEAEKAGYLQQYEAAIAENYEVRADGNRLLLFPRLFFVGVKA